MVLFKLAERSIGFISTLILARLLIPSDFGLVAMASAIAGGIGLMSAFGFDTALIQRQHVERMHYDTAWTYNVLFGVAVAVLLLVVCVPAARFYREPRLEWILPMLAFAAAVQGFENVGTVQFRKEMRFGREFRFLFAKRVATFMVTVALALTFRNYWALVGGIITGSVSGVAISYLAHAYRPRFSFAARAHLFNFSKWLFLSNVTHFLRTRSSDFILGRTIGPYGLGIYSMATEIATLPSTELIAPLNRAVFPAYAKLAKAPRDLRRTFIDVYGVIAMVAFPVAAGLACVAQPAVLLLLGEKWVEATPILRVLTVVGLVGALQSNLYAVIVAMGVPKVNTGLSAGLLVISLPACVFTSINYGLLGAAWTYFVLAIIELGAIQIAFFRVTGMAAARYFRAVWRPILATLVMSAVVLALQRFGMVWGGPLVSLASLVSIGIFAYGTALLTLWSLSGFPKGAENHLVNTAIWAKRRLERRLARR
jgi:lipopolysaccharide exporter